MEQVTGIGPVTKPWQGFVLPLNYTCVCSLTVTLNILSKIRIKVNTKIEKKE